jgi:iron(III) transport system substrate-binding protein
MNEQSILGGMGRIVLTACIALAAGGCWSGSDNEVVVYTALDAEFSQPILRQFTADTGIEALPKYDTESTKTVGLTEAIIAEADRPRCDVFWNNEILHTLRLQQLGLLETFQPPTALEYPEMYRSNVGVWHGFAARARVLIVNTKVVPESERPTSIHDLTDPKWKDKVAIAKPLFGTTATHAACLFEVLGTENAEEFFRKLKENVRIVSGNKQVALAVASGELALGLTDTDDAIIELEKGMDVAIIYPDQAADGLGTLFIPNTLSIVKGCPHPQQARTLVDYLLSPQIEEQLARSASAQIPLHPDAQGTDRVEAPSTVRAMEVDFTAAAKRWDAVSKFLRDEFTAQ